MGQRQGSTNAEKREAVLEAAAVLMAERGNRISLAEICSRAGVSRQSIYNHYGDKAGLFAAVAAQGLDPCPCCPDAAALPPEILLSRYAASLLEWTYAARQVTALRASCRGFETRDAVRFCGRGPALRQLAAVLRQETCRGRLHVADPASAAALFFDLVLAGPQLRIVVGAPARPSPADIEALSSRLARLFVNGCCEPRPGRQSHPTTGGRHAPQRAAPFTMSSPAP